MVVVEDEVIKFHFFAKFTYCFVYHELFSFGSLVHLLLGLLALSILGLLRLVFVVVQC